MMGAGGGGGGGGAYSYIRAQHTKLCKMEG